MDTIIDTNPEETTELDKRVQRAITNLVTSDSGKVWSRLEKIVEKTPIPSSNCMGYCYSIKTDANGNLRTKDLIEFLDTKVVDYSIPKKQINDATKVLLEDNSTSKILELGKIAKGLFTDLKKTGEGGEFLLYLLIIEVLGHPQLLSKMPLKTSGKMHYQGVDGVHFSCSSEDNSLSLYWGESKMYKNIKTGVKDCLESLQQYLTDPISNDSVQTRDIHLISSNIAANVDAPHLEEFLLKFFDKDNDFSNNVIYKGACLVGFDADIYETKSSETIKSLAEGQIDEWINVIEKRFKKMPKIQSKEIHFFLLPCSSVEEFRKLFLKEVLPC